MKKIFALLALASLPVSSLFAQDDDLYFTPDKSEDVPVVKETPKPTYYRGSYRDVDEYNRRGQFRSRYQGISSDSTNDVINFVPGEGVYPDSTYVDTAFVYSQPGYDGDEDEDYRYTRRMSRWDGFYDPWFYGYYYSPWRWGWYSPWYYGYAGWYDPWYYDWYWYDPWYYGYYPWGWYGGWYSPWYYGGWGPGYWGGYAYHGGPNSGGFTGARTWSGPRYGSSASASNRSFGNGSRSTANRTYRSSRNRSFGRARSSNRAFEPQQYSYPSHYPSQNRSQSSFGSFGSSHSSFGGGFGGGGGRIGGGSIGGGGHFGNRR